MIIICGPDFTVGVNESKTKAIIMFSVPRELLPEEHHILLCSMQDAHR